MRLVAMMPLAADLAHLNFHKMSLRAFLVAVACLVAAATAWATTTSKNLPVVVTTGSTISAIVLSSANTTTGLSSGSPVGTLSVILSPPSPTFSYAGTNLHLSATGTDSAGICSAGNSTGNGSFQIANGDTLETNGALTSGTYAICVAAAFGANPSGQAFTITVGNLIDAAASLCAAHGGGDGTSGNPWRSACINAAVAAAANGDTIFLAAGNWTLSTAEAPVVVTKNVNFVGAGSGNTFDAMGHPNNPSPSNLTATPGGSITAVRSSGANVTDNCTTGGFIWLEGANNVSHIYFDGTTGSTGLSACALPTYNGNTGPGVMDDVRALQMADSSYPASSEGRISANNAQNITMKNSIVNNPQDIRNPSRCMNAAFQMSAVDGFNLINSYLYHMTYNAIYVERVVVNGSVMFMEDDSNCVDTVLLAGFGPDGTGIGPGATSNFDLGKGSYHVNVTNTYFRSAGHYFGLGTGINDPTTNGGISDINYTGNWVISSNISLDGCANHWYDPGHWTGGFNVNYAACAPRDPNGGGMQVNAVWQPWLDCSTASTSDPPNRDNVSAGYGINYLNNSAIGTSGSSSVAGSVAGAAQLVATGTGIVPCKNANLTITDHIGTVVNFRAHKNYLSSPGPNTNRWVSDADTYNPSVTGNFCTGGGGTFTQTDETQCATSGFTASPTASFALGLLSGAVVPFASTSFTAQYGAVQWLASTSSTPPISSDARWSFLPPASLSGVTHGDTVYMWVMDSANHISAAASAVVS